MSVVFAQSFGDTLAEGLRDAWDNIVAFTPRVVGALLILLIGWWIARLIRSLFERLFKAIGLDRMLERAGFAKTLNDAGYTASGLTARIVYWIALLIVALLAAQALGIDELTRLLSELVTFLGLVIVAMIIIVVAAAFGSFLADVIRPWSEAQGITWLGPTVRWALITLAVFASFNTLGIAEDIVNTLFAAVAYGVALTLVIAFGVGGIKAAEGWWKRILPGKKDETTTI